MKKPILATLLNIALPGTGYLYLGVRRTFGSLLLLSFLISCGILLDAQSPSSFLNDAIPYISPWEWISLTLLTIALGYDAYSEAKLKNAQTSKSIDKK
jgi:hypothetical protein